MADLPRLLGAVQDREQELERRLVGREGVPGAGRPAQLGVQGLDGAGRMEDPSDVTGEGVEGHHLGPCPLPALADGGGAAPPDPACRRR